MRTQLPATRQRRQRGTALIVVIAILAILIIYAMGNVRTLDYLGKELRLLEQRQRQHIPAPMPANPAAPDRSEGHIPVPQATAAMETNHLGVTLK